MSIRRATTALAVVGLLTVPPFGCGNSESAVPASEPTSSEATSERTPTCSEVEGGDLPATYRAKGQELVGDVDGDGSEDRVTLRVDDRRPAACRSVLVAELAAGTVVAPVEPLDWPGTDPELLLLAQVDDRPGLEPAVALSPMNVYEPGAVFTVRDGALERMTLGWSHGDLFPLDDEFPAGVDCSGEPGAIVVTFGGLADGTDRYWDVKRSFFRAAGVRFELLRQEKYRVEVGPETPAQWPELGGHPFVSCPDRVLTRP
jgi:hypothetical protein